MPLITPSSTVVLYSGINITAGENIIFKSVANQRAYFAKHVVATVNDCTYIRKTGSLRLEFPTATIAQCNYISFTNKAFENKTFYARIIDYEYVNNVTTEINFAIDYFQSYMFDVEYEDCLIEREHLSDEDFQKAETNPWDRSIYEFQTSESLVSGKEGEKIYSYSIDPNDPSGDIDVFPKLTGSGSTERRCGILMQIAAFNSELQPNFLDILPKVLGVYTVDVITPEGDAYGPNAGDYGNKLLPRPYYSVYIYVLNPMKIVKDIIDWLTLQHLDTEIIGIYALPLISWTSWLVNQSTNNETFVGSIDDAYVNRWVNKKLCTSPFYYLRVGNCEGAYKEYQYENFYDIVNGEKHFELSYISIIEGVPKAMLAPIKYRYSGGGINDRDDVNIDERIEKNAYPQIAYSSDAFLSYVSSQYTSTMGNLDIGNKIDYNIKTLGNGTGGAIIGAVKGAMDGLSPLGDVIDLLGKGTGNDAVTTTVSDPTGNAFANAGAGTAATLDTAGTTVAQSTTTMSVPSAATTALAVGGIAGLAINALTKGIQGWHSGKADAQRLIEAANWRTMTVGDVVDSVYTINKSSAVANEYHPGATYGITSYYAGLGDISTFTITKVQLRPEILQLYDKYFSFYGYSSNRFGVPRVCNYIKGSGDQPHFDTTTNKPFTYLKCGTMHVVSPMMVVSEYIEALFKGGCRFFKGEDL